MSHFSWGSVCFQVLMEGTLGITKIEGVLCSAGWLLTNSREA